MNGLVLIAVVASIFGVQAAPQDSNTDTPANSVNAQAGRFSLGYNQGQGLQFGYNQQPQPQYGAYAQSPYPYYPQPQPQPQPQWNQPPQPQWNQPQYPSYPSYYPGGFYQPPGGSYYQPQQTRPNYNQDSDNFKPPESGMVVEDADSNSNPQPSISYPGQQMGQQMGVPSWSQSFTPMPGSGGCYNRCRPRCNLRPPPPPPMPMPMPPPRPPFRPPPPPMPMPMPRPQPQCRQVCRPMCNAKPSCGMGGAQLQGNTMTCGMQQPSTRPMYGGYGGYGGGYGNYGGGYGNYYNQQPAVASSPASSEPSSEVADEDTEEIGS